MTILAEYGNDEALKGPNANGRAIRQGRARPSMAPHRTPAECEAENARRAPSGERPSSAKRRTPVERQAENARRAPSGERPSSAKRRTPAE
ncbi:hypothetical protein COLO4_18519 [Corchorus olitorius]|uniref:Uncharacterized protein n=1 Tax=Corchorus olitorius TaxID=93759 RepID=A0A1R3J8X1_9ROSI|nr:hypothetical protein COLO4_18519 [Corchorus olitorius]